MNIANLYEEYSDRLTRYAISLSRSLDRADDLVQETFVRALEHSGDLLRMNRYQQEAWLKRVLRNRFFDEERANRRKQQLAQRLASHMLRQDSAGTLPDFDAVLDLIPLEHQQVFEKRFRLGMNSTEISQDLGISAGTVRYWLHQSIQCLRVAISQAPQKESSWIIKSSSKT
ncbi:RNA polymerase sigma factor [Candidatus Bipolaricaulota bacterium]|nr:RNA polymerase sigma factor [Candidatus Bipolaricaulota bacterium]